MFDVNEYDNQAVRLICASYFLHVYGFQLSAPDAEEDEDYDWAENADEQEQNWNEGEEEIEEVEDNF